jgi:hypothetical protein
VTRNNIYVAGKGEGGGGGRKRTLICVASCIFVIITFITNKCTLKVINAQQAKTIYRYRNI